MVTPHRTEALLVCKRRRGRGRQRKRKRQAIREMSRRLVESGEIQRMPCLLCGSEESLTIHHFEPIRPDRFVFLCQSCHREAHRPLYRTIKIPVVSGQFSIRPEAGIRR